MEIWTLAWLLALPFLLFVAAWGHVAFWRWRFAPKGRPDEIQLVATSDGWRIALRRYRPRGPVRFQEPVVLCHGLAVNHFNLDWDEPYGLAQYLAGRGHDCFVVSLRGHGGSDRPSMGNDLAWGFSFDDFRDRDVPAVLAHVRAVTGAPRMQWVGHSMGGMLAYALGGTEHAAPLAGGVVALGSPASFADQPYLQRFSRLGVLLSRGRRLRQRYLARLFAPLAGWFDPPFISTVHAPRSIEGRVIRRVLAHAVEDISLGVARQFDDWVHGDHFRSVDRVHDYQENMARFDAPVLLVGGACDLMAPPDCMQKAYERLGSRDKRLVILGVGHGASCDYGHGDLILGRSAPGEVFPLVAAWLEERASRAEA